MKRSYREHLPALLTLARSGMRPGLETTQMLLDRLGNPQAGLRILHVAGTNGKGSTCRFSHALLQASGLRTALFTSPHLVCVRERLVVDQTAISEDQFASVLNEVFPIAQELGATFFETLTAVAAVWFAQQKVDACVIETGLGGRLDSTRALPADLSVVTQIGLDHTEILGDTIEKIWREKIHILRPNGHLLTGETRAPLLEDLDFFAHSRDATWEQVSALPDTFCPEVLGNARRANLALAVAACSRWLKRELTSESCQPIVQNLRWPGRRELVAGEPAVWLDVAHNPDSARELVANLNGMRPVVLLGIMRDKNWQEVVSLLLPHVQELHCLPLATSRALSGQELAERFPEAQVSPDPTTAWQSALQAAQAHQCPMLVTGSFHTVSFAMQQLQQAGRYQYWPEGIVPDPEIPGLG